MKPVLQPSALRASADHYQRDASVLDRVAKGDIHVMNPGAASGFYASREKFGGSNEAVEFDRISLEYIAIIVICLLVASAVSLVIWQRLRRMRHVRQLRDFADTGIMITTSGAAAAAAAAHAEPPRKKYN
jgi:hypothetical protein